MSRSADRILHAIHGLDHPTADEVYDAMHGAGDSIGRATVYRNLAHLVDIGRLRAYRTDGQKRYDPHTQPHAHIRDTQSGRLIDIPLTPRLRDALSAVAADVLETQDDCIVEIRGRLKET